jgi:hypothetical protein
MTSVFSRLFPPPYFLATPGAGLDISDESVKALFFKKKGEELVLGGFFEEKIPEGVLVGGEIQNKEALVALLKDFRKKNNLTFVHGALPEERSYVVRLRLENIAKIDIKNSIELQLVEHIPLPPDQVIFDYTIISEEEGGRGMYSTSCNSILFLISILAIFSSRSLTTYDRSSGRAPCTKVRLFFLRKSFSKATRASLFCISPPTKTPSGIFSSKKPPSTSSSPFFLKKRALTDSSEISKPAPGVAKK